MTKTIATIILTSILTNGTFAVVKRCSYVEGAKPSVRESLLALANAGFCRHTKVGMWSETDIFTFKDGSRIRGEAKPSYLTINYVTEVA